jgi:hypothetical protein
VTKDRFDPKTTPAKNPNVHTMSSNQKALVYNICQFLKTSLENGSISSDDAEGIQVAGQSQLPLPPLSSFDRFPRELKLMGDVMDGVGL